MKIEGKVISDSNITDLVSDAIRASKNFKPREANEFFKILAKINMPKDIARNEERWKNLSSPKSPYFQIILRRRDELRVKWKMYKKNIVTFKFVFLSTFYETDYNLVMSIGA